MSGEAWTVNSKETLKMYCDNVVKQFELHRYLTFPAPRIGIDRSLDQNALFHVWLTEFCAHLVNCNKKQVTKQMIEGAKRTIKKGYWTETQESFMIHVIYCPITQQSKKDFTSSSDWKTGEMFNVLNWFQLFAATRGCILESKGEHSRLTREKNK